MTRLILKVSLLITTFMRSSPRMLSLLPFMRVRPGGSEVLVLPGGGGGSGGLLGYRRRSVGRVLANVEVGGVNRPTGVVMYLPEKTVTLRIVNNRVFVDSRPNPLNEVSVAPLVHNPDLKRPFGKSRITRSAMYYTDAALRTIVRSEVQAEGFAGPQYWIMGASAKSVVGNDRWKAVMGRGF